MMLNGCRYGSVAIVCILPSSLVHKEYRNIDFCLKEYPARYSRPI
jgi:hypothetical protein